MSVMEQIEELKILDDSKQNVLMASKMPEWLGNRWKRKAVDHRRSTGKYPNFREFVEFVNIGSDILNDPFMSKLSVNK